MQDLLNTLQKTGKELQALMAYKLELLLPDIQHQLNTPARRDDGEQIAHLLDELYDCVQWAVGQQEYEQLLVKLKSIDPEAEAFYRKELMDMQATSSL
ncbi:MAG: hypothetical protein IPK21_13765 [Haliscomenobacter sp.]|nr:hypothetical protein [Haliscomenobacter sp.]